MQEFCFNCRRTYKIEDSKEVLFGKGLVGMGLFKVGQRYSRKDIYHILNIPPAHGGNWDTGYNKHNGDWFIFCNLGTPARTGNLYGDKFIGDELLWYAKANAKLSHPSIQSMINPVGDIYIFTRNNSADVKFTYCGKARAKEFYDTKPVKILWTFDEPDESHPEKAPEEISDADGKLCKEGATKLVRVNIYERNPEARRQCIEYYGAKCVVCGFSFSSIYGEIGDGFIHVHHLTPLSEVQGEYEVDPIKDLRPVCPNCHAMLHRRNPPFDMKELELIIKRVSEERFD